MNYDQIVWIWRKRNGLLAVLLLLFWGVTKLKWEKTIFQESKFFRGAPIHLRVEEQVGQGAALAVLSGFRTVLADWLWLKANAQFEQRQWQKMRETLELVCLLQPRSSFFWEMSAWQLAWNAGHALRYEVQEPNAMRRLKAQQFYIQAGRNMLDRGIENIPDHYELWAARGFLRAEKQKDYSGAAKDFLIATTFPKAPLYVWRQVAYNLERAEKWQEAYAFWLRIWRTFPDKDRTPEMHWDRVKLRIQRLEDRLHIAQSQGYFSKK